VGKPARFDPPTGNVPWRDEAPVRQLTDWRRNGRKVEGVNQGDLFAAETLFMPEEGRMGEGLGRRRAAANLQPTTRQ
jgi:ribosomal protein L1